MYDAIADLSLKSTARNCQAGIFIRNR